MILINIHYLIINVLFILFIYKKKIISYLNITIDNIDFFFLV